MAPREETRRLLARTANETRNYSFTMKVLKLALVCLTSLVAVVYVISVLYGRFGSFTVTINKFDGGKYQLTLSETPDFSYPSAKLTSKSAEDITNISEASIPDDVDMQNGAHNGKNYIAYTFYLKNAGSETVSYEYNAYIVSVKNDVDKAIRLRLYENGTPTTYARTRTDGTGPEPGTIEFLTSTIIVRKQIENFEPGDVTKFTIVIWIEGDDPDCTDEIIGGQIKIDMAMTIIG